MMLSNHGLDRDARKAGARQAGRWEDQEPEAKGEGHGQVGFGADDR